MVEKSITNYGLELWTMNYDGNEVVLYNSKGAIRECKCQQVLGIAQHSLRALLL
jgi:hypothetical protein